MNKFTKLKNLQSLGQNVNGSFRVLKKVLKSRKLKWRVFLKSCKVSESKSRFINIKHRFKRSISLNKVFLYTYQVIKKQSRRKNLNSRLDFILVKTGFFNCFGEARKAIKSGFIKVNGIVVYYYSFILNKGCFVTCSKKVVSYPFFIKSVDKRIEYKILPGIEVSYSSGILLKCF